MNDILTPVPHPEFPKDYAISQLVTMQNQEKLAREGPGFSWMRSSRLNVLHHLSVWAMVKLAVFDIRYKKTMREKFEMLSK